MNKALNKGFRILLAIAVMISFTVTIISGYGKTASAQDQSGKNVSDIISVNAETVSAGNGETESANDLIATEGIEVTYNVSGKEKHEALTNDDRKGILFETTTSGSNVTFKNPLTGLFEINFRAFTDETDAAKDWWDGGYWYDRCDVEEFREFAITIQDSETGEMFTVYIAGGTAWLTMTPNARVAYGDVGEFYGTGYRYEDNSNTTAFKNGDKDLDSVNYNTALCGTTFVNRARNTGWIGSGYSTNIGFDPITKEVYSYIYGSQGDYVCYKRTILDLDDAEDIKYLTQDSKGGLVGKVSEGFQSSTFENYTVKLSVLDVQEGKTGKFIVYDINGQSLAGENGEFTANSGYGLYASQFTRLVGLKDKLPQPYASSVLLGAAEYTGNVAVYDSEGSVVLSEQPYTESLTFTPEKAGDYTIEYSGMQDKNGYVRTQFLLGKYTEEPLRVRAPFKVDETFALPEFDSVLRGMFVDLGTALYDENIKLYLTIEKDGAIYDGCDHKAIDENFSYSFADSGDYTLTYIAETDVGGQISAEPVSIHVIGMNGMIKDTGSMGFIGEDCVIGRDDFIIYGTEGEITDFDLSAQVYDTDRWIDIAGGSEINLKDVFSELGPGDWKVRFTVTRGEDSLLLEKTFTVQDVTPPVITAEELSNNFIPDPEKDTDSIKNFIVQTQTQDVVPSASANDAVNGSSTVEVRLKKPSDSSAVLVSAGDTIKFSEEGVYVLVYTAQDESGNKSSFTYQIDARSFWMEISVSDLNAEYGEEFLPAVPSVKNGFTGEAITDFEWDATLWFNGSEIDKTGNAFIPPYALNYRVIYNVTYDGHSQTRTVNLTVSDTTAPIISVDGEYVSKAKVGDKITVFEASVSDKNSYKLVVNVLFNGVTVIEPDENNTFTIDKAGTYTIKYVATDNAGLTATQTYTIKVESSGSSSGLLIPLLIGGAAVVVVAAGVVTFFIVKKKKKNNN